MLMRRWDRARQGEGQFVLIVGEPELGKSRLFEEFHGRLRDTPHTWTEWSFRVQMMRSAKFCFKSLRFGHNAPSMSEQQLLAEETVNALRERLSAACSHFWTVSVVS